ncbi:MAG: amino acid adenylation domain-containing protein, partial [Chloroflexota bacterium]|nr:amino acid adenylation domain-containing protein [Chloroflexota bacterium]
MHLITGGASGVGAAIARGIALDVAPTLLLVGRTPLEEAPERAALLDKLRWVGAQAEYVRCDVTDPEQVDRLVAHIREDYGALTGIVHAAGIVRPGRLSGKTAAQFEAVLAPKVQGVRLLSQAVEREGLWPQFFVAFSSIISVLPGLAGGLGDYAAANAYLDAFALASTAAGKRLTTINWTIWSESGQGANSTILAHLNRLGLEGIGSGEGYRLFLEALAANRPQLVVVNPEVANKPVESLRVAPALATLASSRERRDSGHGAAAPSLPLPDTIEPIKQRLLELLADELEIAVAEIAVDSSFAALGLDSMAAIDLVLTLEQEGFGHLPTTLFFEANTVEKLAAYLAQRSSTRPEPSPIPPPTPSPSIPALVGEGIRSFALSPVQLAFYTNYRLRPDEVAYAFVRQTVRGPLDIEGLQQGVDRLVASHPLLRARFELDARSRQPRQTVRLPEREKSPRVELYEADRDLSTLEDELVNRPLDIGAGEVMRVLVVRSETAGEWHLLLHLHHIVADGWSLSLLAQELWGHYTTWLGHDSASPAPPRADFKAYVRLLQEEADQPQRAANLRWWRSRLSTAARPLATLPYKSGERDAGTKQRALPFSLDPAISVQLKRLAADHDLSLFHLLLALYYRCLGQWTGDTQLVIGIAEARRDYPLPDIQRLVGCLADVFPLALTVIRGEPLLELASRVRDSWLEVHRHTHLSSIDLVRMLPTDQAGDEPRTLSEATFSFARFPASLPKDAPIEIVGVVARTATPATRLALVCWEFDDHLHFTWNYPSHLFHPETVARFARDFLDAVEELAEGSAPSPPHEERAAIGRLERQFFLERIEAQWHHYPERLALTDGRRQIAYGTLARHVAQWTKRLADEGATRGDTVAFVGEPSVEAIVALLAVLRLGATWLPLDPEHPEQRLRFQLATANAKILLWPAATAPDTSLPLWPAVKSHLAIDLNQGDSLEMPPVQAVRDEDIAYIIFTSGSTGRPKGVPIPYRSLDLYLNWAVETFAYRAGDRVMQATSLSFDASLRQCLAPLMAGSAIRSVEKASLRDPRHLVTLLEREEITVWSSVPSLWLRLLSTLEQLAHANSLPRLDSLRLVQLGGETLAADAVRRWYDLFGERVQLANLYGPTEATINTTYYTLPGRPEQGTERIPIGYALPGRVLRVVDNAGRPCEEDTVGELLIGGSSLSPGYLGEEALTLDKFSVGPDGQRFFHTGDLVRQRPDGALLFVGRNDNQVKIRGYRIELEEIERALLEHRQVGQAAVVSVAEGEAARLVAFLEVRNNGPELDELRAFLADNLPEYMLPHRFQTLERLPLMPNGKIDRARLALIAESGPVASLARPRTINAPRTEMEQVLARIWQTVLGVPSVGREDDFFALGGDSLSILEVLVALEEAGLYVSSAADLYRHRTLAAQAQVITSNVAHPARVSAPEEPKPFPLSPAQTGFLMTRTFSPPLSTTWSACFTLEGTPDIDIFNRALQQLVERHPMLRTVCLPEERPPVQQEITPPHPLPVRYEMLPAEVSEDPAQLAAAIATRLEEEHDHLFDLAQWPLMRMRLCRVTADRHVWFVTADHFIGDAFSGWLFGSELLQVYDTMMEDRTPQLPPLRGTFRNYVSLALAREDDVDVETGVFWQEMFGTPYN